MPTKRGYRVESFQEAKTYRSLSSSSGAPEHAVPEKRSYEEERRGVKRVLDQILEDSKTHEWHEESAAVPLRDLGVKLARKDQYMFFFARFPGSSN